MASLPCPPDPDPNSDRKRGREPSVSGEPPPTKRSAAAGDVLFRIVVPSRWVGGVIGKGGSRIQQIRAETGANIKIEDAASGNEERVILISSRDHENAISNAESALYAIAKVVLKESEDTMGTLNAIVGHMVVHTIRLLIPSSQAGCIIGVSGQNIVHIRNSSGAMVNILAKNILLTCASAYESDRIVEVAGNVPGILKALEIIGRKLRENPPRKAIAVRGHNNASAISSTFYLPPSSGEIGNEARSTSGLAVAADQVTSEMMIMEKLVGGLIGRNGYYISWIRSESGATIKVSDTKGEGEQRLITFSGSTHQVMLARTMVENYILTQIQPQNPS